MFEECRVVPSGAVRVPSIPPKAVLTVGQAVAIGSAMVDPLSAEQRSYVMSRVRSRNTAPEVRVRKALHALGFRFRLHRSDLPGSPDIVLPRYRLAIFVHGCFWHRHPGCRRASMPSTRVAYWEEKFCRTIARDREAAETSLVKSPAATSATAPIEMRQ